MLPERIREIIARTACFAMRGRRGKNRRRVYLRTYHQTRRIAVAVRGAK